MLISMFQELLINRLIDWTQNAEDPLRSYATGILAGPMELQDIAANYKEKNSLLVNNYSVL